MQHNYYGKEINVASEVIMRTKGIIIVKLVQWLDWYPCIFQQHSALTYIGADGGVLTAVTAMV